MTTDYPKKLNYKPEGRRNIERPQMRWKEDFREEGTGHDDNKIHNILDFS